MTSRAALLTTCLLFAGAASAQEAPIPDLDTGEPATSGTRWTLGLGAVAFPDYQGSQDYTAAPLWKLFGLSKWQKDLKACWEELQAGDYDWAHLAYTIWPARVKEKCKADRSLAIAHGPCWRPRKSPWPWCCSSRQGSS